MLCIITVPHQRSLIAAPYSTLTPFSSSPPFTLLWRRGLAKQSEASDEAPTGAGYTIEPLWGNGLAHFRGQKGACLSKESPLFTFITETQPRSAVKSLTMSRAHENTRKHTLEPLVLYPAQTCKFMWPFAHTHTAEQDKPTTPKCFTAASCLYSVVNSNYHQVFYFLCTFPRCLRSEWICRGKAFSLFNAVAKSENAPARIS